MAKSADKKSEPFSAGMYAVEGGLFRSRADALAYCKAARVPTFKIRLVPPVAADLDPVRLSLREEWSLRFFCGSDDPVLILEHESKAQAFKVRMSDLVELVSTVKARVRELSKAGKL